MPQAPPGQCTWGWVSETPPAPSAPQGPSAPTVEKHRTKGFTATALPAPLFHPDTNSPACSTTPHRPSGLPGKSSQAQHRLDSPSHTSFCCPHTGHRWMRSTWTKLSTARAVQSLDSLHRKVLPSVHSHGSACGKSQENREPCLGSLSLMYCKLCCWQRPPESKE